jgi:hypothetical protein
MRIPIEPHTGATPQSLFVPAGTRAGGTQPALSNQGSKPASSYQKATDGRSDDLASDSVISLYLPAIAVPYVVHLPGRMAW